MSAMDRLRSGLFPDGGSAAAAADERAAAAGGAGRGAADASLLALIDRLAGILERSSLSELEVRRRRDDARPPEARRRRRGLAPARRRDRLRPPVVRGPPGPARRSPGPPAQGAVPAAAAEPAGPVAHAVIAPLTGIYYASPSPTAPPFVKVGQEVVAGQVIGLIEAMKLFNEIKSDASGRISKVSAENGALVKAKQTLIEVVPL